MKREPSDPKLSALLKSWNEPSMDLADVESNVHRRIAAERMRPTIADRITDLLKGWRAVLSAQPLAGAAVALVVIMAGFGGGMAAGGPVANRIAAQERTSYVMEIDPVAQTRIESGQ